MQAKYEYNSETQRIEIVTSTSRYCFLGTPTEARFLPTILDKGSFLIENPANSRRFTQKLLCTSTKAMKERSAAERRALIQIKDAGGCRNIIALFEVHDYLGINHSALITEHCEAGTLENRIAEATPQAPIPEEFVWHVLSELTSALCFCHSGIRQPANSKDPVPTWEPIYHMNITPANILLTDVGMIGRRDPRVVLSNFECVARESYIRHPEIHRIFKAFGTPGWCPPEVAQKFIFEDHVPKHGDATDIWQMGGVAQVMCRRRSVPNPEEAMEMTPCGDRYSAMLNRTTAHCMMEPFGERPNAMHLYLPIQQYIQSMKE